MFVNRNKLENMIKDMIIDAFRNGTIRCTDGLIRIEGTTRNVSITLQEEELRRIIQEIGAGTTVTQVVNARMA